MSLKALRARVCKKLLDQWKGGGGFFFVFLLSSSPPASPIPQMLTRHEFVAHGGMRVDQVKRLKELKKVLALHHHRRISFLGSSLIQLKFMQIPAFDIYGWIYNMKNGKVKG